MVDEQDDDVNYKVEPDLDDADEEEDDDELVIGGEDDED